MQRPAIALILWLLCANSIAASATDQAFQNLADEYIADLTSFSPVHATMIGDHSADDELDEVDTAAREETLGLLREYKAALEALDFKQLSRANQVDADLLLHNIEANIWSVEVLQEWAWNPRHYINISGSSIYSLLSRDFAPIEQRLMSAAARLEQIPRFLAQARSQLQPERVPRIHAETAIAQNPGLVSIIDNTFASPVNYRPPAQGFDLSVHSCTKYINGHSDLVAGCILGGADAVDKARKTLEAQGFEIGDSPQGPTWTRP